jgi:hypothetical protein
VIEKHGHLELVKEEMKNRRVSNQVKNTLLFSHYNHFFYEALFERSKKVQAQS